MTQPAPLLRLTYQDLLEFPADGNRHELIDGEHYMTPAPSLRHQRVSRRLARILDTFLLEHPLGEIFPAPCDVVLSEINVVEPDLVFVAAESTRILTEQNIQGAPELVIEILSPSTRHTDSVVKRRLYEYFGVQEYWLIDPLAETVTVFRQRDGVLRSEEELDRESDAVLTSPWLPGLQIPLEEVFG